MQSNGYLPAKQVVKERTQQLAPHGMLLGLMILLASCSGASVVDYCSPWEAIRPNTADMLTATTARMMLAHNLTGNRLCGWEEND